MRRESKRYKADIENEDKNITVADTIVLVEQGELLTGILDKNTLGASNGSLIHIIQNEHGPQVCEEKKKTLYELVFFIFCVKGDQDVFEQLPATGQLLDASSWLHDWSRGHDCRS